MQSDTLRSFNDLQPLTLPDGQVIEVPDSFSRCSGAPSLHDMQVDEMEEDLTPISGPVEVFRLVVTVMTSVCLYLKTFPECEVTTINS